MIQLSSTIYREGNFYSTSLYQNATYMGVTYTHPLTWDNAYSITEPVRQAIHEPTVANYPIVPSHFFMGTFDGFWIHKIYNGDTLVMTVQGVDQDIFIPVFHNRVESVSMGSFGPNPGGGVIPDVPSAGSTVLIILSALFVNMRRRWA